MKMSIRMNQTRNTKTISFLGIAFLSTLLLSGCGNSDNDPKFAMEVTTKENLIIKPGSQEFRVTINKVALSDLSQSDNERTEQIRKVHEMTEGNRCLLEGTVTALRDMKKSQIVKAEPARLICVVKGELESITFGAKEEYYKWDLIQTDQKGFGSLSQPTRHDWEMLTRDIMSGAAGYVAEKAEKLFTFGIPNAISKVTDTLRFEKMLAEEKGVVDIRETKDLIISLDNAPMKFKIKTLSEIGEVVPPSGAGSVLDNYESDKIQRNNTANNSIDRFADNSTNNGIDGNLVRSIYSQGATMPSNIPFKTDKESYKENPIPRNLGQYRVFENFSKIERLAAILILGIAVAINPKSVERLQMMDFQTHANSTHPVIPTRSVLYLNDTNELVNKFSFVPEIIGRQVKKHD